MQRNKSMILLPLFVGIFSMTQIRVVGSIGISELICYFAAPFVLVKNRYELRRDGFRPVIFLSICSILGCCVSSWHNNTIFPSFIRGLAVTYSLFALPICLHGILYKNLNGLKWILLGICISGIINIFVFRQSVEVSMLSGGEETAETTRLIMNGPLFWLHRLGSWLVLPVNGWYLHTPYPYAVVAPLIMAFYTIAATATGRSAFLGALIGSSVILLGRKTVSSMKVIQRHFWLFVFICFGLIVGLKVLYKAVAAGGFLNEKAMHKYEGQMKENTSLLGMLMGGRGETFAGLFACFDNPIWGFGPWSTDENDYTGRFMLKYGDYSDYVEYTKRLKQARARGWRSPSMPSHSHIIGFWVRYGILGLPFWLYIAYCMYRHFRHNMAAIPQWYGYFAIELGINSWHIIFSPYGNRIGDCLFITCLLLADAVRKGRVRLPDEMVAEVQKVDPSALSQLVVN